MKCRAPHHYSCVCNCMLQLMLSDKYKPFTCYILPGCPPKCFFSSCSPHTDCSSTAATCGLRQLDKQNVIGLQEHKPCSRAGMYLQAHGSCYPAVLDSSGGAAQGSPIQHTAFAVYQQGCCQRSCHVWETSVPFQVTHMFSIHDQLV